MTVSTLCFAARRFVFPFFLYTGFVALDLLDFALRDSLGAGRTAFGLSRLLFLLFRGIGVGECDLKMEEEWDGGGDREGGRSGELPRG